MKRFGASMSVLVIGLIVAAVLAIGLALGGVHLIQRAAGFYGSEEADQTEQAVGAELAEVAEPGSEPELEKWADAKMDQWMANEGARSLAGFSSPYNLITSWRSLRPGELVLYVANERATDNGAGSQLLTETELRSIAKVMMTSVAPGSPELQQITATTENRELSETYTRTDFETDRPYY